MKQNAQRVLLWLAPQESGADYFADYQELRLAVPEMTSSGVRSVVKRLVDLSLVRSERVGGEVGLSLTEHGKEQLTVQFPALSLQRRSWQGEWSCLVFQQAPTSDPQFRYLRSLLLQQGALALARGVYLYPDFQFPETVTATLRDLYRAGATVFLLKRWTFGDERSVITAHYALVDVAELYSGISKETEELLDKVKATKGLTGSQKTTISSVFDRLVRAISSDPGLVHYYFPQVAKPGQLLDSLRQLVSLTI